MSLVIALLCLVVLNPLGKQCSVDYSFEETTSTSTTPNDKWCPSKNSSVYQIFWPETNTRTASYPMCIGQDKELVYRDCINGTWSPEPSCSSIQVTTLPNCPESFVEEQDFCYIISRKGAFLPECPFPNVLPFDNYKSAIKELVWMPVFRDNSKGFNRFEWIEVSEKYKYPFDSFSEADYNDGSFEDKDCVVYAPGITKLVYCTDKYPRICAYQHLNKLTDDLCFHLGNCTQSDYASKASCFCLQDNVYHNSSLALASFPKLYQNSVYGMLTNDVCSNGLRKMNDGRYVWDSSQHEIQYTYWSNKVDFSTAYNYGASTISGWVLSQQQSNSCYVYEDLLPVQEPSLRLTYNGSFLLIIENSLWGKQLRRGQEIYNVAMCFTNANGSTPLVEIPLVTTKGDNDNVLVYMLQPDSLDSGEYWCEMFYAIDYKKIVSNVVMYRNCDHLDFVAVFKMQYFLHPLDSNFIYDFKRQLDDIIINGVQYLRENYFLRIMRIEELVEENHLARVNFHISSKKLIPEAREADEYYKVKMLIETKLNATITLESFLHLDYCESENDSLTWPETPRLQETFPEEFCFTPNTSLVKRSCEGDFISGARWSCVEACKILNASIVTNKLLPSYRNPSPSSLAYILQVLEEHSPQHFGALDVFLIASICRHINLKSFEEIESFTKITDYVLNFEKNVIAEAQIVTNAANIIKNVIADIMENYPGTFHLVGTKFALFLDHSQNISGLVLKFVDDVWSITPIADNNTIDKLQEIQDLDSSVWLSPELRTQLNTADKVGFSIFFNDALFPQVNTSYSHLQKIFGVYISVDTMPGPIRTMSTTSSSDFDIACLFWNDLQTWLHMPSSQVTADFVVCNYWNINSKYFVINKFTSDNNVTSDLLNILNMIQSSDFAEETLEDLATVSEKFEEFVPVDISLIGQILEKVRLNKNIDLSSLATTVDNLHKVNKSILMDSQINTAATDVILRSIDSIIDNTKAESEMLLITDNFIIFTSYCIRNNVTGLGLINKDQGVSAEIIRNQEVTNTYDSMVVLSPDLIREMKVDGKLIVTVFFNDALFNQKNYNRNPSCKIIGVLLPNFGNYSGPVSIYHRLYPSQQNCVYWNYSSPHQTGCWDHDSEATFNSSMVRCDFWHTTHFGLFLLDKPEYKDNSGVLALISTINTSISLVSLLCILLTAVLFKKWRKNLGNQVLLNFTASISLQIVTFDCARLSHHHDNSFGCMVLGGILHYSITSQFCWMFIIALLQFRRFVRVFGETPKRLLLKACLCGWLFPLVPVILVLSIDPHNYSGSELGICYPTGWGLYAGVWIPILSIGIFNCIVFVYIMHSVVNREVESCQIGSSDCKYHWRLSVLLFFLLGLTWTFGFLAQMGFGMVFVYIFDATATLQGFILFLYFIAFNSNTRNMYARAFNRYCNKNR